MAKWGEGDPRWIVEQRADTHNINNWHWKDVDSTAWSKDFLKDALTSIELNDPKIGKVNFKSISDIECDATCSIRKQKFIFIFDLEKLILKWEGRVNGLETKFTGKLEICNFDHDAEIDDIDYIPTFQKDGPPKHDGLRSLIVKQAPKAFWEAFKLYKESCRQVFGEKMLLKKQDEGGLNVVEKSGKSVQLEEMASSDSNSNKTGTSREQKKCGAKICTKKISISDKFKAAKEDVYNCFVDINKIRAWSRGSLFLAPETISKDSAELRKGSKFELFSKNVCGSISKVDSNNTLEMNWRLKQWPDNHFSNVILKFEQRDDGTLVRLEQTQVPTEFVKNTTDGWKNYYFMSIKNTFGMQMSMS